MSIKKHIPNCRWNCVAILKYKEDGTHFKAITRQVLFEGNNDLPAQLRYFEIASGGHSTLERHNHVHVVMVMQGSGRALVGKEVHDLKKLDVVHIPPKTWHQFQATGKSKFGFICLVNIDRDRPERPDKKQLTVMKKNKIIAEFIKY